MGYLNVPGPGADWDNPSTALLWSVPSVRLQSGPALAGPSRAYCLVQVWAVSADVKMTCEAQLGPARDWLTTS